VGDIAPLGLCYNDSCNMTNIYLQSFISQYLLFHKILKFAKLLGIYFS
jgi:hypothetical protein